MFFDGFFRHKWSFITLMMDIYGFIYFNNIILWVAANPSASIR